MSLAKELDFRIAVRTDGGTIKTVLAVLSVRSLKMWNSGSVDPRNWVLLFRKQEVPP